MGYCLKGYRTNHGMLGGRQFSMEPREIKDNTKFLMGCFGDGTQKGKEEIKTDWINL